MKTFLILALVFPVLISSIPAKNDAGLDFQKAIELNKINSHITSNGGHNINSVRLKLTNTTLFPLKVKIPNGTVFIPDENGEQDLLLVKDEFIALAPKQTKNILLDAYCIESYDSSPNEDGDMTFKTVKSGSKLKKLSTYLNSNKIKPEDIQSAVWAVSDGNPIEHISSNTPGADALRETVSDLTGQENSWYTVNVNRRLDANRRIETSSASISGKLKINLAQPALVHEEVVDTEGNVRFTMKKANFSRAGEWNYSFTIRVRGWEKGDYTVFVFQDGEKIKEYPFQV